METKTDWREQLAFLDNPTQGQGDTVMDKQLTVRLLLAIMYQANFSDSDKRQPWQDWNHASQRNLYGDIYNALVRLDAGTAMDGINSNGEFTFHPDSECTDCCGNLTDEDCALYCERI